MQLAACAIPRWCKCSAIYGLHAQSVEPCFVQRDPMIVQIHALRTTSIAHSQHFIHNQPSEYATECVYVCVCVCVGVYGCVWVY